MGRRKKSNFEPLEVAGIDWRNIRKGDVIPAVKISEMWDILFSEARDRHEDYVFLNVKEWLERARNSIGRPLVFKQRGNDLVVLTDEQAVGYLHAQAKAGLRKHSKNTERMTTDIDTENLTSYGRDQLAVNQAFHSLIQSSVNVIKSESIKLRKDPDSLPPEL